MKKLFALFLILTVAFSATAQDTSAQVDKRSRLENEIRILEKQLKDNASKSANALANIKLLSQRETARRALVRESERQIKSLDDSIYLKRIEIRKVQARLDTMTAYYHRLVHNAYKNRDARVWYMYILSSENIGQAGKRFAYLRNLSGQMNVQAQKIKEAREELQADVERLKDLRAKEEVLRVQRKADLDKLQKEEAQSKKVVTQLNSQKTRYQKELNNKKKQVEALNREIERIIASAMKDKPAAKGDTSTSSADYKLSEDFQSNKGKLPWPAEGSIADRFGQHNHPVYKKVVMPFNNGVNVSVDKGTGIKAVFDGTVKRVIVMPGYNKCALVQHGDYFTFYCKLSSVSVKAGDKVKTGQTIGIVDTIDGQTQFHFQLWKGTTPQDPEKWLRPL